MRASHRTDTRGDHLPPVGVGTFGDGLEAGMVGDDGGCEMETDEHPRSGRRAALGNRVQEPLHHRDDVFTIFVDQVSDTRHAPGARSVVRVEEAITRPEILGRLTQDRNFAQGEHAHPREHRVGAIRVGLPHHACHPVGELGLVQDVAFTRNIRHPLLANAVAGADFDLHVLLISLADRDMQLYV